MLKGARSTYIPEQNEITLESVFQETCPPAYRLEQFEKFCRREYCEENLLFYLQSASEKLANNPEQYQKIKAEYISEAAPSQVNLPESLRQKNHAQYGHCRIGKGQEPYMALNGNRYMAKIQAL